MHPSGDGRVPAPYRAPAQAVNKRCRRPAAGHADARAGIWAGKEEPVRGVRARRALPVVARRRARVDARQYGPIVALRRPWVNE